MTTIERNQTQQTGQAIALQVGDNILTLIIGQLVEKHVISSHVQMKYTIVNTYS